jgi:uncharacterized protein YdaU (DUF1376 family)
MHYYPHHIGDFLKDTTHLNDAQAMTYLRLMWRYYLDEQPLSGAIEDLAFAVKSDEQTVRLILRHFFTFTVDKWHHTRIDKEIADYHLKSLKAKKSANARWNNANAMRTHTERNANEPKIDANHKPITNNHKPAVLKKDPAVLKAENDAKNAAPMPAEIKAKIESIRRAV